MCPNILEEIIFNDNLPFAKRALTIYEYQTEHNFVYKTFVNALDFKITSEKKSIQFPLLPIGAFKEKVVLSDEFRSDSVLKFESSGTSGKTKSQHYVPVPQIYHLSINIQFNSIFGDLPILAFLPKYSDNPHSSLVHMVQYLITERRKNGQKSDDSRFLNLDDKIGTQIPKNEPVILFGAAFGLLDATETESIKLHPNSILIETGGMKTYRKELSKKELQKLLMERFDINPSQIYSEYGMAELLSQAYKSGIDAPFYPPHWMQISIRNPENPTEELPIGEIGQIGIIDLANLYSCSFILTEDRGFRTSDGGFEVLGRLSDAELRGCNFLLERD